MPDIATRRGYDLWGDSADQGPPPDLCHFIRDSDGPEVSLYCHQSEAEEFEQDVADGETPLLSSDTLDAALFSQFSNWLQQNIEGGVHSFDYWQKIDDDAGFKSHLQQRWKEAVGNGWVEKANSIQHLASLYKIKL